MSSRNEDYDIADNIPFRIAVCLEKKDFEDVCNDPALEAEMDCIVRRLCPGSACLYYVVRDVFTTRNLPSRIVRTLHNLGYDFYSDAFDAHGHAQVDGQTVRAFFESHSLPVPDWCGYFDSSA